MQSQGFITDNDDKFEDEDDEMALLTKRFRKFINSKKGGQRNCKRMKEEMSKRTKRDSSKKDPITWYESNKPSHIRTNYLLWEKKK